MGGRRRRIIALLAAAAVLVVPVAAACSSSTPAAGPGSPTHLTVDGLATPVGVDESAPSFSWQVTDPASDAVQSAYRIEVTRGRHVEWDTGRVRSSDQTAVTYAGRPLAPDQRYSWTVQTWDGSGRSGPRSRATIFDTGLRATDWQAQWIKRAQLTPLDATDEYTYARKDFRLDPSPIVRAMAYASADQQYQLHINGTLVDGGPAFSYPDSQYYQATDVTTLLHAGADNAIGLLYHWYGLGKGRPAAPPAAIAEVSVLHADGRREIVATDGTWKVARAPWLASSPRNLQGDPVDMTENIDGQHAPVGWDRPGFADAPWSDATALGRPPVAPWTHLTSARTRIVSQPVAARTLTRLADGSYVADFGAVVAASPSVQFADGRAGHRVAMHAGYVLDPDGSVSTTTSTQATDMSYSYVEGDGAQSFRAFDYLGFRYLQIDDPGEALSAHEVVAWTRHTAVPDEHAASFASSNTTLDEVWALAAHSALFTAQEQFIDTPTREKGPFLRDGFNESETVMAAFGERALTRRALLEFAQSQARYWPEGRLNAIYPSGEGARDIPDFTEIYPEWVWRYELASGDTSLLTAVYPALVGIAGYLDRAIDPQTGLVTDLPGGGDGDYKYGIVDWPAPMRYGYDMATAARTTVNVMAVDAFERVAQVAEVLHRPTAEVSLEQQRASALTASVNRRLTRPDGTYVDGLEANGTPSVSASQHANAEALAYGVVPSGRRAAVAAYAASLGMQMGPMTAQSLLDALHLGGRDADLVHLVTDPSTPGWANILARGGTFTWETWDPSDADGDSMSHGWGSTVLVALQQDLLGVRVTSPGGATADVNSPGAGTGLSFVRGRVPTSRGDVVVSWQLAAGGRHVHLDLTVPPNMRVTVHLPGQAARTVGSGHHDLSA